MTAPLVEVDGLTKHFVARRSVFGAPTATVKAVDGVSFSIAPGETLALVGESGCGKSTVGRLALRLIEPTAGRVRFEGRDITAMPERDVRAFRRRAQLVFQDPYASLNPRMTVGDILLEPLKLHAVVPAARRRARVAELLRVVGLEPRHAPRYPHEFSGGQRQRIAVARALAVEPKLIVCDEPVSALDVSIRSQVLNLLEDLQRRLGLTYIFISHDLAVVRHVADRVAVMYLGRIVETATAERLFAAPRHPYTRALIAAIPVPRPQHGRERRILKGDVPSALAPPAGCHLHTRCPHAIDVCRTTRPQLVADAAGHATACHRWTELPPEPGLDRHDAPSPALDRLIAAFARSRDASAGRGVDGKDAGLRTGELKL
ncbi:MAG TPA: dipeptide ABC transporter ATP-binding protein [Xanthobacteraceae bacterium]|nr:dipeptide ABC transporter ATP-binding protein [Xanthobacteraceae bacterium]